METVARPLELRQRYAVWGCLIWITVVLCLFAVAAMLRPGPQQTLWAGEVKLPQICGFREAFGVGCPGCGLTRCFVFAARLQLAEAWAVHPVGLVLIGYLALTIPQRLWRLVRLLTARTTRSTLRWELQLIAALVTVAYLRWLTQGLGML